MTSAAFAHVSRARPRATQRRIAATTAIRCFVPVVFLMLGACAGPAVSLRYEQHYTVRDEERLFYWVKHPLDLDMPVVCIPRTGMERLPKCSQPWEDLFDVELSFDGPHNRYLQGQSAVELLDDDGAASLRALCSDTVERFQLSRAERRSIGTAAEASGFFDFPTDLNKLPRIPRSDGLDTIVAGGYTCGSSDLELSVGAHHNRAQWKCDTAMTLNQDDAVAPQQMRRLLAAIEKAYAAHSPVSALLPYARCPTLGQELARREAQRQSQQPK